MTSQNGAQPGARARSQRPSGSAASAVRAWWLPTAKIASAAGVPWPVARKLLEVLRAAGMVNRSVAHGHRGVPFTVEQDEAAADPNGELWRLTPSAAQELGR